MRQQFEPASANVGLLPIQDLSASYDEAAFLINQLTRRRDALSGAAVHEVPIETAGWNVPTIRRPEPELSHRICFSASSAKKRSALVASGIRRWGEINVAARRPIQLLDAVISTARAAALLWSVEAASQNFTLGCKASHARLGAE